MKEKMTRKEDEEKRKIGKDEEEEGEKMKTRKIKRKVEQRGK